MMKQFRGLDLTDAQKDEMFRLRHSGMPAMRELSKKRHAAKRAMRELASAAQFDQAKVATAAAQMGQVVSDLAALRTRLMFDMRAVLTDEQRAILTKRMQARKAKTNRS